MIGETETEMNDTESGVSYFVGIALSLVMLVGIPLNSYAIKLLMKNNNASRFLDKIPISLCICNIVQMFPLYILNVVASFKKKWLYGHIGCQFGGFWLHFTANVAVWHIVVFVLVQRKVICSNVINVGIDISQKKQMIIICVLWLNGFIWSAIPFVGWATYELEGLNISCSIAWEKNDPGNLSYICAIFFVNFIFPILILAICYIQIVKKFKTHVANLSSPVARLTNDSNKMKLRRIVYTGLFMTLSFLIAWTPYAVVAAITVFRGEKVSPIAGSIPAVIAKSAGLAYPMMIVVKEKTSSIGTVVKFSSRNGQNTVSNLLNQKEQNSTEQQ